MVQAVCFQQDINPTPIRGRNFSCYFPRKSRILLDPRGGFGIAYFIGWSDWALFAVFDFDTLLPIIFYEFNSPKIGSARSAKILFSKSTGTQNEYLQLKDCKYLPFNSNKNRQKKIRN